MQQLFISYARENKPDVEALVRDLDALGYQTWVDSSLQGGQTWWEEILRRIVNCDVFVAIVSGHTLNSVACERELEWALALNKPVLPLAVERLPDALPRTLSMRQIVTYSRSGGEAAFALAGALGTLPAAPPPPEQLPEPPPVPLSYLFDLVEQVGQPEPLTHEQQRQILIQVQPALRSADSEERRGGRYVLEMFSRRDDLYADVDRTLARLGLTPAARSSPTPSMADFQCKECGADNPPNAQFCSSCDAYLGWDTSPPAASAEPPTQTSRPTSRGLPADAGFPDSAEVQERGACAWLSGSVFAPPAVEPGAVFLVQVFAHLPEQEVQVATLAREFDEAAERRGSVGLESRVSEGERLAFEVLLPGLLVDDPVQSMVWIGRPQSVQFGVTVPTYFPPQAVIGTVTISRDSVPIGHLKFKVSVREPGAMSGPVAESAPTHGMHHYRRAFISYATADRNEVLKRTQMLAGVGIEFFQDILTLEPGERWERRLYNEIDRCDLFLLFWSSAAKKSPWVLKEVHYALLRHGGNELAPPEILPVIIEGPPPVPPPSELAHLHFNDKMVYFMEPRRTDR